MVNPFELEPEDFGTEVPYRAEGGVDNPMRREIETAAADAIKHLSKLILHLDRASQVRWVADLVAALDDGNGDSGDFQLAIENRFNELGRMLLCEIEKDCDYEALVKLTNDHKRSFRVD